MARWIDFAYCVDVARAKTTVYLDESLLRATRAWAARNSMRESEVVEQSLRRLLGFEILEEIWSRNQGVDEDFATKVAYAELQAGRREA